MAIFIGHLSAARYWMRVAARRPDRGTRHAGVPASACASLGERDAAALAELGFTPGRDGRYDLLVSSPGARREGPFSSCRVLSAALPPESFVAVARDVMVASPELAFMLAAGPLPFEELVLYGYELCAEKVAGLERGPYVDRAPLTGPDRIKAFLERCPGACHRAIAERASGFVVPGANSVAEAMCAAILSMPTRAGGYGLSGVRLNRALEVPAALRCALGRRVITPDLSWPDKKVALEYNSAAEHGGEPEADEDQCRLDDLGVLGWKARALRRKQLRDFRRFDRFARLLGRDLGVRVRARGDGVMTRRLNVHTRLYGAVAHGLSVW